MTAGNGIVHSERTGQDIRENPSTLFGIQSWIAQPKEHEKEINLSKIRKICSRRRKKSNVRIPNDKINTKIKHKNSRRIETQ